MQVQAATEQCMASKLVDYEIAADVHMLVTIDRILSMITVAAPLHYRMDPKIE